MATDRIKGLHQKIGSALYTDFVPFGTDGKFVDMLDGLSLEEEIQIGGDHYVTMDNSEENTVVISEVFAARSAIEDGSATNYYSKVTSIVETSTNFEITISLYFNTTTEDSQLVKSKTIKIVDEDGNIEIEEVLNT